MLFKTLFKTYKKLSFTDDTVIEIPGGIEFTLHPTPLDQKAYNFSIIKSQGRMRIAKIQVSDHQVIPVDPETGSFNVDNISWAKHDFYFWVYAYVKFKKVATVKVPYHLNILPDRMKLLCNFEYFEDVITLRDYPQVKFQCYIKRLDGNKVEICIKNRKGVLINDSSRDLTLETNTFTHVNLVINFTFDPLTLEDQPVDFQAFEPPPEYSLD